MDGLGAPWKKVTADPVHEVVEMPLNHLGMVVRRHDVLMHGKTSQIHHDGRGLFEGVPNPFTATRYHSLVVRPGSLGPQFEVSAWAAAPDGSQEIMGIRHKEHSLEGWQFHPESFLTECGRRLLQRFLQIRWPS